MSEKNDRLDQLQKKLEGFLNRQDEMRKEVLLLRSEIRALKLKEKFNTGKTELPSPEAETVSIDQENISEQELTEIPSYSTESAGLESMEREAESMIPSKNQFIDSLEKPSVNRLSIERLIGENIINKIGIIITVIGVGIGTNYVIENDLISPIARIILGYIFSFGLLGVAYRLKNKYLNYSAVLTGGAMASIYLITFTAYSFYALIPELLTFILLVIITAITVGIALGYNREWISVLGLVGGYAVPFLLGDETGSTLVLFSYVLLINLGVLLVALQRYWRLLYYSAFLFTWSIFLFWFNNGFSAETDITLSLIFSGLYFLIFYLSNVAYKIRSKEDFSSVDISSLLLNSFLFFGVGYVTLDSNLEHFQGLFAVSLALIHFVAGQIVKRFDLPSASLLSFINGLVLVFLTLAVPIQLSDEWVTMAWSLEALLLIWLGRVKGMKVYEALAYPVIFLSTGSLMWYWIEFQLIDSPPTSTLPFFNSLFITFLIFWAAFIGIQIIINQNRENTVLESGRLWTSLIGICIPVILIGTLYLDLRFEISRIFTFWESKVALQNVGSEFTSSTYNPSHSYFRSLWLLNFNFAFLAIGNWVNNRWFNNKRAERVTLFFLGLCLILFFFAFFDEVKSLRRLYIYSGAQDAGGFEQGIVNILNRYVLIAFGAWGVLNLKELVQKQFKKTTSTLFLDLFISFTIIFLLSSELIQWLDLSGFENSYKLGLSILWGISSMGLIFYGIIHKKEHLRIFAMAVFSITLIKLFFYDISHLSTISKTIVFIALGVLLLVISYMYNRFKDHISNGFQE
ncbi:MAG: DUF2339 domain-containing protein [Balneola sp.]|nr:MAG: DUF2339 domain-containing protein [Balneola sp.]